MHVSIDTIPIRSIILIIFSYTQNLSSVLSDPNRSRNEVASFFTRHWGESYVVKTTVPPSPHLPKIGADHFRVYLSTTAKVFLLSRRILGDDLIVEAGL